MVWRNVICLWMLWILVGTWLKTIALGEEETWWRSTVRKRTPLYCPGLQDRVQTICGLGLRYQFAL